MEYSGGGGGRWRGPRGGGWHNNSPRFRGGHNNQNFSPRFGGGGGRWSHRHSSPYDPNFRHRSPYQSPQQSSSPRFFSTPQRFHHPRHQNPADLPIDAWVSPAMWEDPWKYLIEKPSMPETQELFSEKMQDTETTESLQETSEIIGDVETSSVQLPGDSDDTENQANKDTFSSDAGKDLLTLIS